MDTVLGIENRSVLVCVWGGCILLNLCTMGISISVSLKQPLGRILNKWKEYSQKPMTKKRIFFLL